MPRDDRLRLEEEQALLPIRLPPPQSDPEQTVCLAKSRFAGLPPERGELMPKCQILQHNQAPGLTPEKQGAENNQYDLRHMSYPVLVKVHGKSTIQRIMRFSLSTTVAPNR